MVTGAAEQRRLAAVVTGWTGRGVLVVGDAMLDEWRFAESDRLCREAPAPVLTLRKRLVAAGGAANTAVNLAALGGQAALVAPVGADVAGDEVHDCLDRAGVWDRTVSQPGRPTPVKRRLLAGNQILVREDEGDADETLHDETTRELLVSLARATEELRTGTATDPALVVCDYGLGALPGPVRAWLVEHRRLYSTVALDAHDLTDWRGLAPTVVTPSFAEAARLLTGYGGGRRAPRRPAGAGPVARAHGEIGLGITVTGDELALAGGNLVTAGGSLLDDGQDRAEVARSRLAELRERTGADVVAVTLDTDGAVVGGADGEPRRSHATPVPASHTVGAGDAYLAAMTLALAAEAPLHVAAQLAQLAATVTVAGTGTCICHRDDLLAALGVQTPQYAGPNVVEPGGLGAVVERHRRAGHSIVFTNGCFDVLHRGHVRYLEQARGLGDLLLVAVNSDDSVRRLKGPDRPVNPVEDRVAVLAALSCVDYVVVFEEDSPTALIETVRPEVYVKGGDYPPELVPEAPLVHELGGEVHTLGYVPDRSTSAIIDRIRSQATGTGTSTGTGTGPPAGRPTTAGPSTPAGQPTATGPSTAEEGSFVTGERR
ncbi:D-glycero-beta-D-manno-heptose 1-phosphate adenylyltransferase [Micromonospora zhanjiangensis]|uniref:D-glycero-beta-D-manno-heptose 1-phosphate adenylyltransferase n=1 Tax=Micromonospora zhanjiangensis TaxID=1522057 RepID=A0ABV8KNV3_9ACTN